jgi:hypothetical protein
VPAHTDEEYEKYRRKMLPNQLANAREKLDRLLKEAAKLEMYELLVTGEKKKYMSKQQINRLEYDRSKERAHKSGCPS